MVGDSTEPPQQRTDVARDLVARLERGTELAARGSFTFDQTKILGQLGAHALAERERYVLVLVEAANLLRGCTALELDITPRGARVAFVGVELGADELDRCFDPLFASSTASDPEDARHQRGRQRLALALSTMIAGATSPVKLQQLGPAGGLRLSFAPDGAVERDSIPGVDGEARLTLELRASGPGSVRRAWARRQIELLESHASASTIPLWLDDRRLDAPDAPFAAVDLAVLEDAGGAPLGRVGWSARRMSSKSGSIVFVANGVAVETVLSARLTQGAVVIADATDLERDLSQFKLVANEARQRRIDAILDATRTPSSTQPWPGNRDPLGTQIGLAWTLVVCAVLALGLGVTGIVLGDALMWIGILLLVPGLWGSTYGFAALHVLRDWERLDRRGAPRLGVVETVHEVEPRWYDFGIVHIEVEVRVHRPDGSAYTASCRTLPSPEQTPGDRIYLRVDPDDPGRVTLERHP